MDQVSVTVALSPTTIIPLTPAPTIPPSNSALVPSSLDTISQNVMSSVVRTHKAGAGAQPPRPPNAWILYRSDKLQKLPPPPLGQPKPTQAEVSKIISAQWRAESEDVRAVYEKRAEMAKAEHARVYPNYRFAPVKKADKDRMREERRQAKEQDRVGRRARGRVAPYPLPSTASAFQTPTPLVIKHVIPNAGSVSPSDLSVSSTVSTVPPSRSCVSVAPYHGSTSVSPDASIDLQLPHIDSPIPSHESSILGATVSPTDSSPTAPLRLILSSPQVLPPKGWEPSPSDPPTPLLDPIQDVPLPYWHEPAVHLGRIPPQPGFWFRMPGYENLYLQNPDSGFQPQCSANDGLIAPPPDKIEVGTGTYPPWMCGSTAFDDPLSALGEDPETFMLNPTVEQLLATINTLVPPQSEENVSSLSPSPDPQPIDSTPAFNFDDFVKDFGVSASQETTEDTPAIQTCTEDHFLSVSQSSSGTPTSHLEGVQSPMPSFYVATPSPTSTEPTPPPVAKGAYVPPRGAANSAVRRVGGSWKAPMAVSRRASPISGCTANQVVA